ncbi:MAG: twin-arginine translocase subunit TatC [Planctomycetota bacterium]
MPFDQTHIPLDPEEGPDEGSREAEATSESPSADEPVPNEAPSVMPFAGHLEELRGRMIFALGGLLPIVIAALVLGKQILALLIAPVQEALIEAGLSPALQATGPLETFYSYLRIAVIASVLVGSPWVLYQAWRFVAPGLYAAERRFVYVLLPLSVALTTGGVLFLYYVILPVVLAFFIRFGSGVAEQVSPVVEVPAGMVLPSVPVLAGDPLAPEIGQEWINTVLNQRRVCVGYDDDVPRILGSAMVRSAGVVQQYRVSEYVKLFMNMTMAFSIGFQTPVVVLLLGWAGLVTRGFLAKYRRYALMGCLVAGALLTPADPFSMLLLAGPLYLLYEFGMILMLILPADRVARGVTLSREDRAQPRDDA